MLAFVAVASEKVPPRPGEHCGLSWTDAGLQADAQLLRILRGKHVEEVPLPGIRIRFELLVHHLHRVFPPTFDCGCGWCHSWDSARMSSKVRTIRCSCLSIRCPFSFSTSWSISRRSEKDTRCTRSTMRPS